MHDRAPPPTSYSLASRRDDLLGGDAVEVGRALEHLAAELAGVEREHALEVVDRRVVALGRRRRVEDHRVRQDRARAASSPSARLGSIPFWRKRSMTSVAVEPTGSNVARTGTRGLDRADVVVVEDLDDLGLLDARHALRLLGVVDQQHAARRRVRRGRRG